MDDRKSAECEDDSRHQKSEGEASGIECPETGNRVGHIREEAWHGHIERIAHPLTEAELSKPNR